MLRPLFRYSRLTLPLYREVHSCLAHFVADRSVTVTGDVPVAVLVVPLYDLLRRLSNPQTHLWLQLPRLVHLEPVKWGRGADYKYKVTRYKVRTWLYGL